MLKLVDDSIYGEGAKGAWSFEFWVYRLAFSSEIIGLNFFFFFFFFLFGFWILG